MLKNALAVVTITVAVMIAVAVATPALQSSAQRGYTQWEYLTVDYSQAPTYATDGGPERYETIEADAMPYRASLLQELLMGCEDVIESSDVKEYFWFDPAVTSCIGTNFKGREHFLGILGNDGWELIQFFDKSSQYSYSVEMIFKRPKL